MSHVLTFLLRWVGIVLFRLGLGALLIRIRPHAIRILLYHDCEERESDFTAGLQSTTTPAHFALHLAYYARHYEVVPLSRVEAGDVPRGAAVITFDDGYRSVFRNAVPLLRGYRMPSTVYLVTSVVGNQSLVWVNEMNWLLRRGGDVSRNLASRLTGLPPSASPERHVTEARLRSTPTEIEAMIVDMSLRANVRRDRLAEEARLYLDWDEVRRMMSDGVIFGNHTATHPSLPRMGYEEQRGEMARAWEVLRRKGCHPQSLAYPFGDHTLESRKAALDLGCSTIMEVGLRGGPVDLRRLGRIPVDGIRNEAELFARVEVVEPMKAWLRDLADRLRRRIPDPTHRANAPD